MSIIEISKTSPTSIASLAAVTLIAAFGWQRPAAAESAHDYIEQARLFYNVVACADDAAPAKGLAERARKQHCRELADPLRRFQRRYVDRAAKFLAKRRPKDLPDKVVYPFGGGDLVSALITYPDALEYTTISLEHAGDPRRLVELDEKPLQEKLALFRETVTGLLNLHDSTSKNLRKLEAGALPGQLSFFILALRATGHEPVSLRFFRLENDGSLHYFSRAEVEALDDTLAKKKGKLWVDTDYSVAFSHMELQFRRAGEPQSPVRVHRHFAYNLDDDHFRDSPLYRHLAAKGKVAAMTKAATYLLWMKQFSAIRDYLLDHMVFMFSDSTGIPPVYARRKGFEQVTYGTFMGSFLPAAKVHNEAFLELWTSQPQRPLPFRYGYTDNQDNYHMLVTRPARGKRGKRSGRARKTAAPAAAPAVAPTPAGKKAM